MNSPGNPSLPLIDGYHRRISYLRLSVTDRCNLRCSYCMPAEGVPLVPRGDLLSGDQLILLAEVALQIGIKKIRITGGEPLLRPDIVDLMARMGSLPGLERLVLTTNGFKLPELAADLAKAGVHGVNISIDSLQPERFAEITRRGSLAVCREGIAAALATGFRVKLNVVVMAGINDDEILDFVELARDHALEVRFIEYMPTQGERSDRQLILPSAEVLKTIAARHDLESLTSDLHAGPARRFQVAGHRGSVGVISPVSCHFCQDCNRIRVTAAGLARSCLFHEAGLDLRPWLISGDTTGLAAALRQVVAIKPEAHTLGQVETSDDQDHGPIFMSRMGG